MFRVFARSRIALIIALISPIACSGSKTDEIDRAIDRSPDDLPELVLRLSDRALDIEAGSSSALTVELSRGGDFDGPIAITVSDQPEGIEISGGTIPSGESSLEFTIRAADDAQLGTVKLTIEGEAEGATIESATLTLNVTAPEAPTLALDLEGEAAGDLFGSSLALSADGRRIVIGAPMNDGSGNGSGHARVFERSGARWMQLGADIDGEAVTDRFGGAVAISDDGTRIAVGSYQNDGGGNSSGHVRVFGYQAGAWTQVGGDIDGTAGDGAGWAVAMSASGHRVVVGGPGVGSISGDVRVYELMAGAWVQLGATFTDRNELGAAVAISDDGSRIALSLPSAAGISRAGTVRVYDWNGSAWTSAGAELEGEAISDNAGGALSLSGDGNTLAIGASSNPGGGADGGGINGGHVRVYRFAANSWTQLGADLDGAAGDQFGTAVAISADGTRLLAGGIGVVRFYELAGSTWTQTPSPNLVETGRSGEALAISADGRTVGVGDTYFRGVAGAAAGVVRISTLP
jgi:hypothetical protein